jgi:hypothetical protein
MRTGFNIEELVKLVRCGVVSIRDDYPFDVYAAIEQEEITFPSLAAVEAWCVEECKRKWPESEPTFDIHLCGKWRYFVDDSMSKRRFLFASEHPDRPAALVELVEAIAEKEVSGEKANG